MANKHNLVTFFQSMVSTGSTPISIGGAVPTGKTRFVTFVRVSKTEEVLASATSGLTGVLGVATDLTRMSAISTIAATLSGTVLTLGLAGVSAASAAGAVPAAVFVNQCPTRPNMNPPIVSVGSGKYLYYGRPKIPAASLFVQYYDE